MEANSQKNSANSLKGRWVTALFLLLALLCMLYFIAIVVYSGINTSFCLIWPVFSVVFILMGYYSRKAAVNAGGMPQAFPTFMFTTFALFCAVFMALMGLVIGHTRENGDSERTDYTIVLGAKVYSTGISRTLMYRLDRAYAYYLEHPETKLVLSGGQESGDAVPEALAMYNYLSLKGVPGSSMIIEFHATSTAENIRNSIRLIAEDTLDRKTPKGPGDTVWDEDYIPVIAIITSDFHMMRSSRIAREMGVGEVVELPVRSDGLLFIHQCVRESAAIIKDYFAGNIRVNEEELPFNQISRH